MKNVKGVLLIPVGLFIILSSLGQSNIASAGSYISTWGVFHSIHTTISDGKESTIQRVGNLKSYYDWGSTVDHDTQITSSEWSSIISEADGNNKDGSFSYFAGYEWKGISSNNCEATIIFSKSPSVKVNGNEASYDTLKEVGSWLSSNNGIGCINHPLRTGNVCNWNEAIDTSVLPCVEILNKDVYQWDRYWNCSAGSGCSTYLNPTVSARLTDTTFWSGSVKNALDKGLHLGFVAGWDYHGTYPSVPIAYTGLKTASLTRDGVIDAVKKRHTWAGQDKIMMDVSSSNGVGNFIMGDIFTTSLPTATIDYKIDASSGNTISRINLFVNGIIVKSDSISGLKSVSNSITRTLIPNKETYFFIEAIQSNGKRAWSSPIWITYNPAYLPTEPSITALTSTTTTLGSSTTVKSSTTTTSTTTTTLISDKPLCSGSLRLSCSRYTKSSCSQAYVFYKGALVQCYWTGSSCRNGESCKTSSSLINYLLSI